MTWLTFRDFCRLFISIAAQVLYSLSSVFWNIICRVFFFIQWADYICVIVLVSLLFQIACIGKLFIFHNTQECMNSTKAEALTKCLFRFSSRGNFPITVTTRSRGMVKRGQGLCYNSQSVGMQDFVSLSEERPGSPSYYDMDTMFVLSENRMDPASGVTCFGQDVAAYHEIVTIMVRYYAHYLSTSKTEALYCCGIR